MVDKIKDMGDKLNGIENSIIITGMYQELSAKLIMAAYAIEERQKRILNILVRPRTDSAMGIVDPEVFVKFLEQIKSQQIRDSHTRPNEKIY
jgi:hypothetical protein